MKRAVQERIFGDPWKNMFYASLGIPGALFGSGWTFRIGVICVCLGVVMAAAGWLVKR